jgi:hypothetical protein
LDWLSCIVFNHRGILASSVLADLASSAVSSYLTFSLLEDEFLLNNGRVLTTSILADLILSAVIGSLTLRRSSHWLLRLANAIRAAVLSCWIAVAV